MQIKKVTDPAFRKYGRILSMEVPDLLERLSKTPLPQDVVYVPGDKSLEDSAEARMIQDSIYGGMPVQIGYCNGNNHKLNAVEYHRDSEVNIPVQGCILILGSEQDIEEDYSYDTSRMESFEIPAKTVVEIYGTTLHYAPCNLSEEGFQVAVILPRGTNTDKPTLSGSFPEDRLMTARNKWLIAHEESGLGDAGAFVGLKGDNLTV
ncbi:DUF4867 family protein [Novisyntrophococcus fermenticellae]|uniref:DUF4867 family protein n=1 Tax=Novisyntrophococcus fermenticellae TaxID=2068655 RepID=UPI001E44B034|nr:DUF4867 family protein [Novisyntrophococcus fermenticellae]